MYKEIRNPRSSLVFREVDIEGWVSPNGRLKPVQAIGRGERLSNIVLIRFEKLRGDRWVKHRKGFRIDTMTGSVIDQDVLDKASKAWLMNNREFASFVASELYPRSISD